MWFLPRVSALGAILIVVGALLIFALGLEEIAYVLSGIVAVVLLIGIISDRYEGPKK